MTEAGQLPGPEKPLVVREVAFRRKFNLSNYETLDIELVATVGPGDDAMAIAKRLDAATVAFRKARG